MEFYRQQNVTSTKIFSIKHLHGLDINEYPAIANTFSLGNILMTYLNPNYVLIPFQQLLGNCQNNVLLGLRLSERVEKFPDPTDEELQFMQIYLNGHITDIRQSKIQYKQWILKNGFEEIHNCIRITLERLYVYKEIEVELKANPSANLTDRENELKLRANKFNFPDLTNNINHRLAEPLQYQKHIETINNARNCFVHRNGIVGSKDFNNSDKDKLIITGNRFKMFFKKGEEETPAMLGKLGPENAALMLGAEEFAIEFESGKSIDISLKQFIDILNTCIFFNADIDLILNGNVA